MAQTPVPYLYSFSGSDTLVKISFEQSPENEVKLNSVNTLSISVHEQKSPVRRLGHAGVVGFTSSARVIGGSIILTAINGHPLQELITADLNSVKNQNGKGGSVLKKREGKKQLKDFYLPTDPGEVDRGNYLGSKSSLGFFNNTNKGMPLCTVLPPMQIRLIFVSEYNNNIVPGFGEIILNNVSFVAENIVMSVNNMVTEFVLQFVASDMKEFQFTDYDFSKLMENQTQYTNEKSQGQEDVQIQEAPAKEEQRF